MTATTTAAPEASPPNRAASPFAKPPSAEPSNNEMAELTVMAVCFEPQKSQNVSPENKQA